MIRPFQGESTNTEVETWPARPLFSRRRALALGAAAAATSFLAACGNDEGNTVAVTAPVGDTSAPLADSSPPTIGIAPMPDETVVVNTTVPSHAGTNSALFGGGGGDGTLKIGFTAPLTGALAGFGEATLFTLDAMNALAANGLMIGDRSYEVQIIAKDVESNSDTATARAGGLITDDAVDLVLAIATPEMINPVADQCEANGVPCLSTLAPWQPYFFGRGGDPTKGFDWTYHFFWGTEQLVSTFVDMWNAVDTNKTVGLFCPNDFDGNALADPTTGFAPAAVSAGYTVVDPGRFETSGGDFSGIIGQMRAGGAEILCGIANPDDFATFWTQAKQQGFNPKFVTIGKAMWLTSALEGLGDIGDGLAGDVGWTPNHPFTSSLTGETAQQLSDDYEGATGKQWTQLVGFAHALFEVCFEVVSRAGSTDKQAIAEAAATTSLDTIVGPIAFGANGTPRNIGATSLVGGQWQKDAGGNFPFDLLVVDNTQSPEIPTDGELKPLA